MLRLKFWKWNYDGIQLVFYRFEMRLGEWIIEKNWFGVEIAWIKEIPDWKISLRILRIRYCVSIKEDF